MDRNMQLIEVSSDEEDNIVQTTPVAVQQSVESSSRRNFNFFGNLQRSEGSSRDGKNTAAPGSSHFDFFQHFTFKKPAAVQSQIGAEYKTKKPNLERLRSSSTSSNESSKKDRRQEVEEAGEKSSCDSDSDNFCVDEYPSSDMIARRRRLQSENPHFLQPDLPGRNSLPVPSGSSTDMIARRRRLQSQKPHYLQPDRPGRYSVAEPSTSKETAVVRKPPTNAPRRISLESKVVYANIPASDPERTPPRRLSFGRLKAAAAKIVSLERLQGEKVSPTLSAAVPFAGTSANQVVSSSTTLSRRISLERLKGETQAPFPSPHSIVHSPEQTEVERIDEAISLMLATETGEEAEKRREDAAFYRELARLDQPVYQEDTISHKDEMTVETDLCLPNQAANTIQEGTSSGEGDFESADDRRKRLQREAQRRYRAQKSEEEREFARNLNTRRRAEARRHQAVSKAALDRQGDAAAHAFSRSQETPAEREVRLANQAIAQQDRRGQETPAETAIRLANQAIAQQDRRGRETPAETAIRLANQVIAQQDRRGQETPAETAIRLANQAIAQQDRRGQETPAETAIRLANQAIAQQDRRGRETPAETAIRLANQVIAQQDRRGQETPAETAIRLANQAIAQQDRRGQETPAETAIRLANQAIAQQDRRGQETPAETAIRLAKQAIAQRDFRDQETPAERQHRVGQSVAGTGERRRTEINNRIQAIQQVLRRLRDNKDEGAVERHHCGLMNVICPYCKSLNFPGENTEFTKCCRKGKLIIKERANEKYPDFLKEMMSNKKHEDYANFRDHIRNYNSSVSFASMGANIVQAPGHGPYCFKVHGQVYHKTSHVLPVGENRPQYAQLYILDRATQVVQTAIQHPANVNNIVGRVLKKIVEFMREENRLALTYRMMADVLKAEEQKAKSENREVPVVNMIMRRNRNSDARRYNLPLENEVAMVFVCDNVGEPPFERDIQIYPVNQENAAHHFIKLNILSANLDPMTYAILFPYGQPGWHPGKDFNGFKPSMLQYKQALVTIRDKVFNPILRAGRLTQQWIVDSYLQVEANNLNYVRYHQKQLRAEEYSGLRDYVNKKAEEKGLKAGQPIILPSSFEGSPRNMRERLQDAMSIFGKFGAVDAFITFTANPSWPEIVDNLEPGETSSDRPDLIAKVFKLKLKALVEDITVNHVLGRNVAWVYTIEFQKRGLPHAHILVVFAQPDKFTSDERIDEVVCAEIPDKNLLPDLYRIVVRSMLHGPCGTKHPDAPCMEDGKCSKEFPKVFQPFTELNTKGSGYGIYRRRDTGIRVIKSGTWLDNRYVVPYNKYLLLKYDAHINVEVCTSMKAVKYIYKYIYKGFDCANVAIGPGDENDREVIYNEIDNYIDARYISAPEGMWRLLEYPMHGRCIAVIHLPVHLPNQQKIYFESGNEAAALAQAATGQSKLTAWFKLNETDENARLYRYTQIPEHYVFIRALGAWQPRKRGSVLPRIYNVSPADQELFNLRLLLLHVPGATSFEYLRTVDDVLYPTFKEGALHRQLISDDTEWMSCMAEAATSKMPNAMRQTFALICLFCNPRSALTLFTNFEEDLTMDFRHRNKYNAEQSRNLALLHIESVFQQHGKSCIKFGLPAPVGRIEDIRNYNEVLERRNAENLIATLNAQQKNAFDKIVNSIEHPQRHNLFFLNGPGGSGKTYLYNCLISYVRGLGKTVKSYATTGIASTLIKDGTTVHSGFGLPFNIEENSTSKYTQDSPQAKELREASLLIIDECSGLTSHALRIIERLLRCEVMRNNQPFGGKVLVLGGDFRQTLPVVPGGRRVAIFESCIVSSNFWDLFEKVSLITNMRSKGQNTHNEWLLNLGKAGTGRIDGLSDFAVNIPNDLITENDIVDETFGKDIPSLSTEELSKRVILCSTNKEALLINNRIISKLPGDIKHYYSSDSIDIQDVDDINQYPDEFLHEQQPSGMPPHTLSLKKGAIVILLRNLNKKMGLCNGTRMVITDLKDTYLQCQIISDFRKGDNVILSRLDLTPSETKLPFQMRRRQFPILPAFAMTINKAQGQSFDAVGIYLNDPVFAHGQLYVALSRSRDRSKMKVFMNEGPKQGQLLNDGHFYTENIVYKEVFRRGGVE